MIFLFLGLSLQRSFAQEAPRDFMYSTRLAPQFSSDYYVDQGLKYFDTLDTYADRSSKPEYAKRVIRWEWYPWLKLTGYKRWMMKLDLLLILYPTRVINRDCRFFNVQPFARCRVSFQYKGSDELVNIYEEFTFNDFGEMTFIEAWTDEKSLLPMDPDIDPWGEQPGVNRLSTKIPGLGTPDGKFNPRDENLELLATQDEDIKDFKQRIKRPIRHWLKELIRSVKEYHKERKNSARQD